MGDPGEGIEKGELLAGLQILVFHRTLANQNLLVSDEISLPECSDIMCGELKTCCRLNN